MGVFTFFLNCANGTKLRNASQYYFSITKNFWKQKGSDAFKWSLKGARGRNGLRNIITD